jgi:chromosome segregation ATPase
MSERYDSITPPLLDPDAQQQLDELLSELLGSEPEQAPAQNQGLGGELESSQREHASLLHEITYYQELCRMEHAEKMRITESSTAISLENEALKARIQRTEQRCMQMEVELLGLKQEITFKRNEILQLRDGVKQLLASNQATLNVLHRIYY